MIQDFWVRSERSRLLAIVLALTVVVWELAARWLNVPSFLLPAPSAIYTEFASSPGYFLIESVSTLETTLAGFALAVVIGVALAIAIVYSRFLDRTLYTALIAMNSVPKVALAPLFVIWLGTGFQSKIAIAMLIAVFPILIDTVLGLKSIDPEMLNMARAGQASTLQTLVKIRFPNALPSMFAGMKVAISLALVGAIVGEFVAGSIGLGHVILAAQGNFDTPRVFVALVLLGILGTLLFNAIELVERLTLPWHVSHRGQTKAEKKPIRMPRAGSGTLAKSRPKG
jgi:NitT/TauT family transport system permease protein